MRIQFLSIAAFAVLACALPARAGFEGDFVPRLAGNTIITDGASDLDGSIGTDIKVFQYSFSDPTSPGFTEDPGFRPDTTSGLPGGSFLGFNVVTPLFYWDGNGAPNFAPVVDSSHLELYIGTQLHVFATGGTAFQNGFVIAQLSGAGSAHQHLSSQLLGAPMPGGAYVDANGNTYGAPDDGVYAVGIDVVDSPTNTTNPFAFDSGTRWLVYGQNVDEATLTAGADSLVPEPASLSLLALGGTLLITRRRSA